GGPSSTPGPSPRAPRGPVDPGAPAAWSAGRRHQGAVSRPPVPLGTVTGRDRARWPAPPAQGAVHLRPLRRPAAPTPAGPTSCSSCRAAPTRQPSTARRRVSTTATRRTACELDVARALLSSDELRLRRDEHGQVVAVAAQRSRRSGWGVTPSRPGAP